MTRTYTNHSIESLEEIFVRAQEQRDGETIRTLLEELTNRRTARARDLRSAVEAYLEASTNRPDTRQPRSSARIRRANPPQADLFGAPSRFAPTREQAAAIDHFKSGRSLKINAFAGTGKTSTLQLLAHATGGRGQYIAFNKAIVRDAKGKFPNTVNSSTTHGLAFKALASRYSGSSEKLTGRMNANQLAELLGLKRWRIDKDYALAPRSQGFLILETIRRFTHSGDPEPLARHVPTHGNLVAAPETTLDAVRDVAIQGAKYVWGKMKDPADAVPLGHDGYLKLWALDKPRINGDFILLDEAQDTNPVILDVLTKQDAQMVYVGDRYQQIYEWRGAVNAMNEIETDSTTFLTTSFRFGSEIAQAASRILSMLGEPRPVQGNPAVESRIGPIAASTILARTNASTITAVIDALDANRKPHLVGGNGELIEMLKGVQHLKANESSNIPEFFGFESWKDVVEFARSGEGSHLQTFVNLVEERGERQLMWALNRTVQEDVADLTISTVHKAKGREWKTVRLMDDFLPSRPKRQRNDEDGPRPANAQDPAELRLLYVAITRARTGIEIPTSALQAIGLSEKGASSAPGPRPQPAARSAKPAQAPPQPPWSPPKDWKAKAPAPGESRTTNQKESDTPSPKRGFWQRIFGR